MASYTANLKIIRSVIKDEKNQSLQSIEELIKVLNKWVDEMPDILQNGLFSADRKLIILGLINKLELIRLSKSAFVQKEEISK
jgi:hypothetical protein